MIQEGQVVLFRFPQTDQLPGKLRPAVVIREIPGSYGDLIHDLIEETRYKKAEKRVNGFRAA